MSTLDLIKSKIKALYDTCPDIHINVSMTNPRLCLENKPVTIKGVYPHIFRIEEHGKEFDKYYTVPYTDVLTKQIVIEELELNC